MHPSETIDPNGGHPQIFDEFFELGQPETSSPFLTPKSRQWGINLTLRSSILAAFLLLASFLLTFSPSTLPLSHFLLMMVYFLAGIPSLIESIEDLLNYEINIDILMTFAAFSSILIGSGLEGGLLLVLFAISGSMEDAVTTKAKGAISSLHRLSPTKACVIDKDGTILERSVKDIAIGTQILIKAGQVVPLDGVVIEGTSSVNMVHLTGESLPITKKEGDQVPAGAFNQEGSLTVRVTLTSADSTLARIIDLVTQAQEARPQLQRWFDQFSNRYATTIILLSFFFALTLPFFFNIPFLGYEGSLYRALAFLIASSPCALIIAIPIAYLSALSSCARRGILLKGGIILDALAGCSIVAFDKTGTLTLGDLQCLGVEPLETPSAIDSQQAIAIAHALERSAVHPIAKAIDAYAKSQNISYAPLKEFKSIPGYGLEGIADLGKQFIKVTIGHPEYIASLLPQRESALLLQKSEEIRARGELIAALLVGTQTTLFRFTDTPRPKIKQMIEALKRQKWNLLMLTGDHRNNAKKVAEELGIDDYYADLRPEDKLEHVDRLSKERGLAMIGDGINDAPALARATVGICMGKVGSSTAIEAADIVLLHDNLELLDWLMDKALKTQSVVKQNLTIAIGAILIAAIPSLGGWVPLWLAVVMHEGGTVLVGLNALRLLK